MKLYNVTQIKAEDFAKEDQQTIEKLGNIINPFMQQVVDLTDGRISFDNTTNTYKEFEMTVNDSGVPTLNGKLQVGKSSITGFQIIHSSNLTNIALPATEQPYITSYTTLGGGLIQINKITGLVANNKFLLRMIVY